MKRLRTSTVAAAGLAALLLSPTTGFAVSEHHEASGAPSVERGPLLAHMGGGMAGMMGSEQGYPAVPCPYGMAPRGMNPGMTGGMMGGMMGPA